MSKHLNRGLRQASLVAYLVPLTQQLWRGRSARCLSCSTRFAYSDLTPKRYSKSLYGLDGRQQFRRKLSAAQRDRELRNESARMTADGAQQQERVPAASRQAVTFIRARHILLESQQMANTILERVQLAESGPARTQLFASLAQTLSTCETRTRGGDLGWFRRGQMVPAFEEACLAAEANVPFKVRTEFGWHVVEVLEFGHQRGVISVKEFAELYQNSERRKLYQLIDVREPGELEIVQLEGFMNLPLNEYSRWRHLVEGSETQPPVLDRNRPIVVMCHHGIRSATMCAYLCQQGFSNVLNLLGGIDAYAAEIDQGLRRY